MPETHRLKPGKKIRIADLSTRGRDFMDDRDAAEKEFKKLRIQLAEWQNRLYSESKQKLLIVLQAMDAGGKDGTIRKVFQGVNPQGVRVSSFKKPTGEELAHDFLWRIHKQVPAKGMIRVFNRSHYEDVLVVRAHNFVPQSVWEPRFDRINEFEELLTNSGTRILKFFLHISLDEQKERFQDRIDIPEKNWKFDADDLNKRKLWPAYMEAFEDVLNRTNTDAAPWYAIPADNKWYRNLVIQRAIVSTLEDMNPQYPTQEDDLSKIVID
ncbi:polyphosphate kinase 2 family protein [bacterium]|nr:polyphosphate kinase 2 family protein [bacterium]